MKLANVPVKGWVDFDVALKSVMALPTGYPRMILVHGEPGLGKTTAVDWFSARYSGVYMVASSTWSQRVVLEKLAERLGVVVKSRARVSGILDAILTDLERRPRGLIVIDEFDRVAHKVGIVELVREIYDISDVPIVLVGMASIEQTLSDIPQFPQRIGQRVAFEPVDQEDARKIADKLCEVTITDDLLKAMWTRSGGVIRLLVTEIAQAEVIARREGLDTIGLADTEAF